MSLSVRLNGNDYVNFIAGIVKLDIGSVLAPFSFTSSADQSNAFPIRKGDFVEVLVDGEKRTQGKIENIKVDYTADSHTITVSSRGALADFVDSSVGEVKEFTGQVNLIDICRAVLDGQGLTDIQVINNAGTIENFDAADITSAEIGMTGFEFCELFARKRQVLLTTDGFDLVLARTGTERVNARLKNAVGAADNNVLSASFESSDAERFNTYTVQSQLNIIGLDAGDMDQISGQRGVAVDSQISETRKIEFDAEESSDSFTATDRAKWEANIRRAKSLTYQPKIQGHNLNSEVLQVNRILNVVDDFCNVKADLLIKQLEFAYDLDSGSTSTLKMTYKDAYSLQVEQDSRGVEEIGEGLF